MEEKFYLIEISTGDAKIAGKAVYEYGTAADATAAFHSKLGVAMKSELYDSELVVVIDHIGWQVRKEYFSRNGESDISY